MTTDSLGLTDLASQLLPGTERRDSVMSWPVGSPICAHLGNGPMECLLAGSLRDSVRFPEGGRCLARAKESGILLSKFGVDTYDYCNTVEVWSFIFIIALVGFVCFVLLSSHESVNMNQSFMSSKHRNTTSDLVV